MKRRNRQSTSGGLFAPQFRVLRRQQRRIEKELPDLISRDQMRKEARDEATLSGELRRAVHASRRPLTELADAAGIPLLAVDQFLTANAHFGLMSWTASQALWVWC